MLVPLRPRWIVCLLLGTVVACDNGQPAEPDPPDEDVVEIRLTTGLRFVPDDVTIDPGTTVRWVNDAALFHTITPDEPDQPGVWSREVTTTPGPALTHTFDVPGETYTYHCEPHLQDGMVATIRVR